MGRQKGSKSLRVLVFERLKAAGDKGVTIEELYAEFKRYTTWSVSKAMSDIRKDNNVKRIPYRVSGDGNILFRFTLLPPKKIDIK